jgi:hypothetical protein
MTRLIAILAIALAIAGGYGLFKYWETFRDHKAEAEAAAAAKVVTPEQLPGMPYQLQASLDAAKAQGLPAMRNWMKAYDPSLQDPRKAWIELDYCVMVAREDPNEAKRIFAAVKARLEPTSPVWPRIQELQKSYE